MIITAHSLAAIAISSSLPTRWAGFLAGLLSHFILDIIPHGHGELGLAKWIKKNPLKIRERIMLAALIDWLIMVPATLWLLASVPAAQYEITLWTIAGSVLPDLIWGFDMVIGEKLKPMRWFIKLHKYADELIEDKLSFQTGLGVHILVLLIIVWIF